MITKYPSQTKLKELFNYREDGNLIRKIRTSNSTHIGDVVGCVNKVSGYSHTSVDNKLCRTHRLIWIYHNGYNPENDLDHIDRNKLNNKINNLREVARSCNLRNTGNQSNNTSGVKGVHWYNNLKKYRATIHLNGLQKHLGYCHCFNEAVLHRLAAEQCLGWEGCDSSSPAYQYCIENNLVKI